MNKIFFVLQFLILLIISISINPSIMYNTIIIVFIMLDLIIIIITSSKIIVIIKITSRTSVENQHLRKSATFDQTELPSLNTIILFRYFCRFDRRHCHHLIFFTYIKIIITIEWILHQYITICSKLFFSIFTLMAFLILTFGASMLSGRRPIPNLVRKM